MKVMIKRFALRHNGKTYQAGQTAELPEETAKSWWWTVQKNLRC